MTVLTNRPVTTRKSHRCFGCDIVYPPGTLMRRFTAVADELYTLYYCPICEEVTKDWDLMDWEGAGQGEIRFEDVETWNRIRDKQAAEEKK